jgi:hypothetical protein
MKRKKNREETNKYSLSGKIHWKGNKYLPKEKIYKGNKK